MRFAVNLVGNGGLAFVLAAGLSAAPAGALPPPQDEDHWEFDLAIYSWITDMKSTITTGDTTIVAEPQLWNDIISNLDMALFGAVEARYQNRWILNLDLAYAALTVDSEAGPFSASFGGRTLTRDLGSRGGTIPINTPIGDLEIPARFDGGTLRVDIPRVDTALGPFDIETKLTQFIARAFVGYRLFDVPLFEASDPRRVRFDLFGGIRYYDYDVEIDIEAPPVRVPDFTVTSSISGASVRIGGDRLPGRKKSLGTIKLSDAEFPGATLGGTDIDENGSTWWIDPVIGARVGVDVSEKISLLLMGNVGGFGIGSASDFSWETAIYGSYRLGDSWSLALGYRALGFDKDGGDVEIDQIMHGPVIGAVYRF